MNENIDLTEILKDCPEGTELYSAIHGKVHFVEVVREDPYPILVDDHHEIFSFTAKGLFEYSYDGEILLFPSKDQRDWSKWECPKSKKPKFDPKTLLPFDRVLVRCHNNSNWFCNVFSHIEPYRDFCLCVNDTSYKQCIPYNDETKHLVGTSDEAPEYYRYWEE